MDVPDTRECPGCGLRLAVTAAQPDARFNASPECWQLHGELTAYTLTRGYGVFVHQLLVDAYAAQHVAADAPPIRAAFALIGLFLTCERGQNGRQVQYMHMLLARRTKSWPRFTPPARAGDLTILDVLHASPGDERDAMLRRWGQSVWDAWGHEHARVRALFERVMAD